MSYTHISIPTDLLDKIARTDHRYARVVVAIKQNDGTGFIPVLEQGLAALVLERSDVVLTDEEYQGLARCANNRPYGGSEHG